MRQLRPGHRVNKCRCFSCKLHRADRRRRERLGESDHRVPFELVEPHLLHLLASGVTRRAIDRAAGLPPGSTCQLISRRSGLLTSTAEAILSVTDADRCPEGFLPAADVRAAVQAMREAGLLWRELDDMVSRSRGWTQHATECRWVQAATHARIVTLYRLLARAGRVPVRLEFEVAS